WRDLAQISRWFYLPHNQRPGFRLQCRRLSRQSCWMKKTNFAPLVVLSLLLLAVTGLASDLTLKTKILPLDQIHAGMRGVAYTVFQGTTPESMEVEVLGVLRDVNGPKGDVILVRLHGAKVEYTGVVAGMSGSPVYIDGKLVGALAFRIGEFSKEPIAGVTPIQEMLEISELDRSKPNEIEPASAKAAQVSTKTASPGVAAAPAGYKNYLTP